MSRLDMLMMIRAVSEQPGSHLLSQGACVDQMILHSGELDLRLVADELVEL